MKRAQSANGPRRPAYSQTLDNGLRILKLLAKEPQGLNAGKIATSLEIDRTAAYRLLGTLKAHNVIALIEGDRYVLGFGMLELTAPVRSDLRRIVEPYLADLANAVNATACMTVVDQEEAVSACVVEPRNTQLHVAYRVGTRHPLTAGAAGLAILAGRAPVPGERAKIKQARADGYVVTKGELQAGAWGLAAPIKTGAEAYASIGVIAMTELDTESVAEAVLHVARLIESAAPR